MNWQREGRGRTAILELEHQVEGLANDVDLFGRSFSGTGTSLAPLPNLVWVDGQVSAVDMLETKVQEMQTVVADLDNSLTKLEDDLVLRVDEIAKSVLDGSLELQVLARSVKNLEQWGDEVAYRHLRPLHDRVTHLEHCLP